MNATTLTSFDVFLKVAYRDRRGELPIGAQIVSIDERAGVATLDQYPFHVPLPSKRCGNCGASRTDVMQCRNRRMSEGPHECFYCGERWQ